MTILYTRQHEWIDLPDDGGPATIGITAHAQDALGDVVYVDLPAVGSSLGEGDTAGVVESVKAAADLYMPIAGEVVAVNEALRGDPSLANSDPTGAGWFFKVRIAPGTDHGGLLDAAAYEALLKTA